MRDGSCLVTVVAGASFLALMELSRLGAFNAISHSIGGAFAPHTSAAAAGMTIGNDAPAKPAAAPKAIVTSEVDVAEPPAPATTQRGNSMHETRSRERPSHSA